MFNQRWLQLLASLLIVELVAARTIVHHKTTTITNGDNVTKSWTTSHEEASGESPNPFSRNAEVLHTPSTALQYSPSQTEIIRIGGSGIPTEELVKQPHLIRGIEPEAIAELLRTKQPVVRTDTNDAGQVRTKTITLEADGSIVCKTVTEAKAGARVPIPSTYWDTLTQPAFTQTQTQSQDAPKPHFSSSRSGINFDNSADKWPSFEDFMKTRSTPSTAVTVKTPVTWDPSKWNTGHTYSSSIPKLPELSHINPPTDEIDKSVETIGPKTTTTYTYEPTTWTRSYNWTSFSEPTDDFWKSPFETTLKTTGTSSSSTPPSSTIGSASDGTKPTRTLDLGDLPITGILDSGKPFDESFFSTHLLPENTRTHTFKVDNIPVSRDWPTVDATFNEPNVEKKVKTFTQNVYSSTLPTSGDLDPKAREILEKAGINPNDLKAVGDTITKTREEPDGRVITTTYKVRTVPSFNTDETSAPKRAVEHNLAAPSSNPGWKYPSFENFPTRRVEFESSGAASPTLGFGGFESNVSSVSPAAGSTFGGFESVSPTLGAANRPIEEYLSKVNLNPDDIMARNGEVRKTIVDADGRVLTATFVLSAPLPGNNGTKGHVQMNPIK